MGEANAWLVHLDDPRGRGLLECLPRPVPRPVHPGCHQLDGGRAECGRREQRVPRPLRQRRHPGADERAQAVGKRQNGLPGVVVIGQRASDLDREERITSRRLPDPAERPPGERASQPKLDDLVQRGRAERPQHDARHLTLGQRLLDLQPWLAVGPDALAGEQADRQPPEPPGGEREHPRDRAVEPVQIIDRDQHGRGPCQRRQDADRRGSHGPLIKARTTRVLAQQGHRSATIRRDLIDVAARAARRGRGHLILHLPEYWHRETEWRNLFEAACGPPQARAA